MTTNQAEALAAAMQDAAIRYAGGHVVDFAKEAEAITTVANQSPAEGAWTDDQIDALMPEPDGCAQDNIVRVEVLPGLMGTEFEEVDAWSRPLVRQAVRAALAASQAQPKGTDAEAQEWNYVIECRDGFVPNVKGPFNKQFTESTLREFAAMRPSYLMVVRSKGWPEVQSGVEWIDMCGDKRRGRLAVQAPAPAPDADPLFLLHCGQIDSSGEQDDWDIEADSGKRVEEFCRLHPGQTVNLYPHVQYPAVAHDHTAVMRQAYHALRFAVNNQKATQELHKSCVVPELEPAIAALSAVLGEAYVPVQGSE